MLPEIWIPYGSVETLVTIQAENLGAVAEASSEAGSAETERIAELVKTASSLFVCDSAPATLELLRSQVTVLGELPNLRLVASAPKRIEFGVPELRGKVTTLPPPLPQAESQDPVFAPQLSEAGTKLFVGTARPDPLFGIVDTKVEACLNWVARSRAIAASSRQGMEPEPFQKTEAYDAIQGLIERIGDAKFLTALPRGGKLWTSMEDAPFDAIKNGFPKVQLTQTKGIVVGAGGRGYDDSLSSAIRGVWSALEGVRRTGSVLLVAECSEGVGSTALEMLVTGRTAERSGRKEKYMDGIEEVFYLNKLKDEYDVLLLSGLPETYARSKLGLTTARGAGEAVGRILNKVGRSGKLNVVPRAPECFVQSG
jgi:hypothetical protein